MTLAELLQTQTEKEIKERLLAGLNVAGFPITDWESGGAARTIVEAQAAALNDFIGSLLPKIAGGGFLDYAEGDWLTLLAEQLFQTVRTPATFTRQSVRLTCAPGSGPYTINVGESVVEASSGNRYINVTAGTVPSNDTITLDYQAEAAGAAYLDPAGQISKLVTSLPGLSVLNAAGDFSNVIHTGTGTGGVVPERTSAGVVPTPATFEITITGTGQIGAATYSFVCRTSGGTVATGGGVVAALVALTAGTSVEFTAGTAPSFILGDTYSFTAPGSAIVQQGRDVEDDASLRTRCRARWPDLARVETDDKYALWAMKASADVVRTRVTNLIGAPYGRVQIIIAGTVNPLPGGTITAVQNYIDQRCGISELPVVVAAVTHLCPAGGTVYVKARDLATVQAKAQAAWNAYVGSLDIGEAPRVAELAQAIMDAGAIDFYNLEVEGHPTRPHFTPDDVAATSGTLAGSMNWMLV